MSDNRYQEHAEKLSKDEICEWYIDLIQSNLTSKLTGRGAKLLSAPRGAGKSMLFKKAYYLCIDNQDHPLPIYVNYSNYIKVDAAGHNRNNYFTIFRKWVLGKILLAVVQTLNELEKNNIFKYFKNIDLDELKKLVYALEGGTYDPIDIELSPEKVCSILISIAEDLGRPRVVLLLDDAAHAFTPELQREFFGLFRALSTIHVSPKAAVYPGITSYGDKFHSGHDAEIIKIGIKPEDHDYTTHMINLLRARFSKEEFSRLEKIDGLLETLSFAASGIPRALIVMARYCIQGNDESGRGSKELYDAWVAINEWNGYVWNLYNSIALKAPRFRHYISCGKDLLTQILNQLKAYNSSQDKKTIHIAIEDLDNQKLKAVTQFLEYAGIIFERPNVSRGDRGIYLRYMVHVGMLIEKKSLGLSSSRSFKQMQAGLSDLSNRYPQLKHDSLVAGQLDARCQLDMPVCQKCSTPRPFPEAKFCAACGAQLIDAPMYGELIRQSIDALPLPERKIAAMKASGMFSAVGDLLQPGAFERIQTIPRIGMGWARKIVSAAEEFSMT